MSTDDLRTTVAEHGERIGTLEDGYARHNDFLFGRYDQDANQWIEGFATRLSDAVAYVKDIRDLFKRFVGAVVTALGSALVGAIIYVMTHLDKVEHVFR